MGRNLTRFLPINIRFMTKEIIIHEGQYLREVLSSIPTNTILVKTLTGLGATYSELKADRNSIIIEPNKPVILGKEKQERHRLDNLLGVYEGVSRDAIADYLNESMRKRKHIKIMTTPESFRKVQDACEDVGINIQNECFLLFDECHKLVKDVDFRTDITLPMDFFFNCVDKAMVSATPINCQDPRFNKFQAIRIVPDFDYKKRISIRATNNVLQMTRELLSEFKDDDTPVFFFVNSTDTIYSLMKQTGTINESSVFCSAKSVEKLKDLGFRNVSEEWGKDYISKYNWLTSRFYNAFDIEIDQKPIVVMVTECYVAEWSMLDPYADTVQILGRFRNGIGSAYHICNFNPNLEVRTKDEILISYKCSKSVYDTLRTLMDSASTKEMKEAFYNAIQTLPYNRFLDDRNRVNYFAVDNYIDEELVKTYYHDPDCLVKAYKETGEYFTIDYQNKDFPWKDTERIIIESKTTSLKEKRKTMVEILDAISELDGSIATQYKRELEWLGDKLIVEAFEEFGKDKIEELDYSPRRIREALVLKRHKEHSTGTEALELIYNKFKSNVWYGASFIKNQLNEIFEKLNIPHQKAITSHTILDYFNAVDQRKKSERGYLLISPKFDVG
jgi:hypothetical protein